MTIRVCLLSLAAFSCFFSGVLKAGEGVEGDAKATSGGRLLTGECVVDSDPLKMSGDSFPMGCVRAKFFGENLVGTDSSAENLWLIGGSGSSGIHLSNWMSIQAEGTLLRAEGSKTGRELIRDQKIDVLTLNLGNPALHRWRLVSGRPQLTFGVADSPLMESFQLLGNKRFWSSLDSGVVGIYDNKRDLQVEMGGFSTVPRPAGKLEKREGNDAAAIRMMYDIPALDGSRMVVSFYGDRKDQRKVGFAFINVSVKNDLTHFEFVRSYQVNGDGAQETDQLLRVGYVGAFRSGSRWAVVYDDVRKEYRLGVLGQDFQFKNSLSARLGLGYRKSESDAVDSRWFLATGAQWDL